MNKTTTLDIDPSIQRPLNPIWTFGANTCHAPLQLRGDLLNHLAILRKEAGFRYIRAHNTLSDGIVTLNEKGGFDYSRLGQACQNLLDLGYKPFLELSSLPKALSRGPKAICAYKFYVEPPANWDQWYQLVHGAIQYLTERFGHEELRQWYFEVWNEPNIPFWIGTQAEYFKLYDLAAKAVKQIDPAYRIGGPATARCDWIPEFCDHVTKPSADFGLDMPRCDFVATHAYPSDTAFVDSDRGEVTLQNSNLMRTLFAEVRATVDAKLGKDFPVIAGEWNSSAGPYAFNHDDCNNAAYIAKTMTELMDITQGSLYWNASDIYQEGGWHYEPFHGGYGLMTVNDLPKASAHAFRLLNQHTGQVIAWNWTDPVEGVGCLATRQGDTLRLLLWNYTEPDANPAPVSIKLTGLPVTNAMAESILPERGSAYETWRKLASPQFTNRALLEKLENASKPLISKVDLRQNLTIDPGTIVQLTLQSGSGHESIK